MKAIYAMILGGIVVTVLASCGKSGTTSAGANEMSTNCITQTNGYAVTNAGCNGNQYSNVSGFGPATASLQAYGYASSLTAWSCGNVNMGNLTNIGIGYGVMAGIQGSTSPVYSPTLGAGCVYSGAIQQSGNPVAYGLSQNGQYFITNSYTGGTTVYRACEANEPCPTGQSCRSPFGATVSSSIGICYSN